jgi:HPt (histidine-containing phosphotransfer) domain-containing protein
MLRDHLALRISGETELPACSQAPIDLTHLARMTLGDRRLQQEILDLFDQQIGLLIARMNDRHAATLGALAHTLKGSARSIGAWDLVRATEAVEAAVASGAPLDQAIAVVAATGARVREAISQMRQNEADVDAAL